MQNKTIKFFISSTFKDFEGERNILQKFVFPKLKELCHKNGFGFQPIDLRWGIQEEAGLDQQTMNICLNEIKRSSYEPKPNLLLLVGQRYGWVPLPYEINENEFTRIIESTELPNEEKKLINEWYEEDKNSRKTSYYLKDKHHLTRDEWNDIEKRIKKSFQKISSKDSVYHTSATEQEMYEGLDAFDESKNHNHTFAYFRTITNYDINNEDVEDYIDIKEIDGEKVLNLEKIEKLDKKLKEKSNIPEENQITQASVIWNEIEKSKSISYEDLTLEDTPKYLKEFHSEILEKFINSIQNEIDNFTQQTQLQIELEQQRLFLEKKSEIVIGRKTEVTKILDFIKNDDEQFYLQYGKSGSGKTSFMAKAIKMLKRISKYSNNYNIYYRFIGTTANSTYSRQLFENIYWEIESDIQKQKDLPKPHMEIEEREFKKQFKSQLEKLQDKNKKIVIFFDALDQFEDYNDLTILLDELPSNIKIVFSTLYDENKKDNSDYSQYYNRLEYLKNKDELLPLKSANEKVLTKWLNKKSRKLTDTQWHYIKPFIQDITPLHLRLIFEIVKQWKSEQSDLYLKDTQEKLIIQFFNFVQKQYHHEESLLEQTLGYISASKDGLSEEELIDLFSNDKLFLETFQNHRYPKLDRLPNAIWSRFYYYIEPFFTEKLIDNEMLIKPYHRIIEEVIKEKYYAPRKMIFHDNLASLFYFKQDKKETWDKRYYSLRMLTELPYQFLQSKNSIQLKKLLFDLEFAGSIYNHGKQDSFSDIISKATTLDITEDEIYPWESFYRENEHLILKVDEELWRPHQSLFQLAYEDGEDSVISSTAQKLLESNDINFSWIKLVNRNLSYTRSGLISILKKHSKSINGVEILKDGKILSYSDDYTLILWNNSGEFIKVLEGHTDFINGVKILKDGKILSYSDDGTLILWSNSGEFIKVLEGHTDFINGVKILDDERILTYSQDMTLRIWDKGGHPIKVLKGHTGCVNAIEILNNGQILSWSEVSECGNDDFILRLWSNDGNLINNLTGHLDGILGVEVLKDGRFISWSKDCTLRLWNKDGKLIKVSRGHSDIIAGIEELNNGTILSWSKEGMLRFWSKTGELIKVVKIKDCSLIEKVKVLYDGRIIICSNDGTIRVCVNYAEFIIILSGHKDSINGIELLNDGRLLSWSKDSTLRLWNSTGVLEKVLDDHKYSITGVKILEDGRILSWSKKEKIIMIWSYNGNILSTINNVYGATLLDKERIVSYSNNYSLRVWTLNERKLKLNNKDNKLDNIYNSKNYKYFFKKLSKKRDLYCVDNKLMIINRENDVLAILNENTSSISKVKVFGQKERIISWSDDCTLRLWTNEGKLIKELKGHKLGINGVRILNDGRILSWSDDCTLRLWTNEGKLIKELKGHNNVVIGTKILNDGRIVSWSWDNTIRLWDKSGMELKVLKTHIFQSVINIKILKNEAIVILLSNASIAICDYYLNLQKVFYTHDNEELMGFKLIENNILTWSCDYNIKYWDKKGKLVDFFHLAIENSLIRKVKRDYLIVNYGGYDWKYNFCKNDTLIKITSIENKFY